MTATGTFLARLVGYVPTPRSWPSALRKLHGEYQLSRTERIQPAAVVLVSFAMAAVVLQLSFAHNGILPSRLEKGMSLLGFVVFVALGLLLFFTYWTKYIFDSGILHVILPGGHVFRTYPLQTLVSVTRIRGKVVDSLTLRWEREKHWILLPASLLSVLPTDAGI